MKQDGNSTLKTTIKRSNKISNAAWIFFINTHIITHKYRCKHTGLPSLTEEGSAILFKNKFLWCINTGAGLYLEAFQEDPGFGIYDERDRPRRESESFDNEFLCLSFACLCLKRVGCCLGGHLQSEKNKTCLWKNPGGILSLEELNVSFFVQLNPTQLNVSETEAICSLVW